MDDWWRRIVRSNAWRCLFPLQWTSTLWPCKLMISHNWHDQYSLSLFLVTKIEVPSSSSSNRFVPTLLDFGVIILLRSVSNKLIGVGKVSSLFSFNEWLSWSFILVDVLDAILCSSKLSSSMTSGAIHPTSNDLPRKFNAVGWSGNDISTCTVLLSCCIWLMFASACEDSVPGLFSKAVTSTWSTVLPCASIDGFGSPSSLKSESTTSLSRFCLVSVTGIGRSDVSESEMVRTSLSWQLSSFVDLHCNKSVDKTTSWCPFCSCASFSNVTHWSGPLILLLFLFVVSLVVQLVTVVGMDSFSDCTTAASTSSLYDRFCGDAFFFWWLIRNWTVASIGVPWSSWSYVSSSVNDTRFIGTVFSFVVENNSMRVPVFVGIRRMPFGWLSQSDNVVGEDVFEDVVVVAVTICKSSSSSSSSSSWFSMLVDSNGEWPVLPP